MEVRDRYNKEMNRNLKSSFIVLMILGLGTLLSMHYSVSHKQVQGSVQFQPRTVMLQPKTSKGKEEKLKFEDRREKLLEVCNTSSVHERNQPFEYVKKKYLLYDSKHNFVFCMVQKIGCTFWRRVFYSLQHTEISNLYSIDRFKVHDEKLPTLEHFNTIKAKRVLRTAKTAMFVREPYERAYSGYLDKLFNLNPYYMNVLGKPIIKLTRKHPTPKSLKCGHDVTFKELIQYLVEQKRRGNLLGIDHHFSPIHSHCLPCDIKYDLIGKMESFHEDASYVMRNTSMFNNISITMSKNSTIVNEIYTKWEDAFKTWNETSDCMSLNEVVSRTWQTLQLRGLVNPDVPMPHFVNVTLEVIHREAVKASDPTRVSEYRHRGYVNMYKTVDRQLLFKFREYVLQDCKLFGYSDKPSDLFS